MNTGLLTHVPKHTHMYNHCLHDLVLQAGGDVLVNAATGSGKTLAYLAPIVDRLAAERPRIGRQDGTRCLIVAPTRELVLQIQAVLGMLLKRFVYVVRTVVMYVLVIVLLLSCLYVYKAVYKHGMYTLWCTRLCEHTRPVPHAVCRWVAHCWAAKIATTKSGACARAWRWSSPPQGGCWTTSTARARFAPTACRGSCLTKRIGSSTWAFENDSVRLQTWCICFRIDLLCALCVPFFSYSLTLSMLRGNSCVLSFLFIIHGPSPRLRGDPLSSSTMHPHTLVFCHASSHPL